MTHRISLTTNSILIQFVNTEGHIVAPVAFSTMDAAADAMAVAIMQTGRATFEAPEDVAVDACKIDFDFVELMQMVEPKLLAAGMSEEMIGELAV